MPWWEGPEPECCLGGLGGVGRGWACIGLELVGGGPFGGVGHASGPN